MNNIFLETKRLLLEPLDMKHFSDKYVSWLNTKEVVEFNRHGVFPNNDLKTKEYINSVQQSVYCIVLAMIDKDSQKHIGNIAIQNIDFINSNADVSIMIGDKVFWGKGYAYEAYEVIINHAFNTLNLHKIYIGTSENNIGMNKVAEKLGMKKDGIKRDALYKNGEYFDIHEYSILKNEFYE
ncbi:MAG: GNAT family N-acetyltransferase [Helicobacteraceae bacterium]|nr:GNAT family N-acetyltransferase [Helicobacteraceae bacterium]